MELVKGNPITDYCDEHRLTLRQRLELFVSVCRALQHAHQKGIIHRDIKPSNVLVAPYDGKPVVKIIDFGIAKATGQRLTERTLYTEFGAVVGTLEYMSPEQAELNNQDIDTRSDIYSLGVLLYELLTGTTPLNKQRLQKAAFTEVLQLIREEEPPKPSTRLSSSKESLPAISAQRNMDPVQLSKSIRGELDWIVMKALDKERSRRYETANGLARDVERYLADEPVEACPPSAGYRLRKLARKHRRLLMTAAAFAALLVLNALVSAGLAVRATVAEGQAKDAQIQAEADRDRAVIAEKVASERLEQTRKAEKRAAEEAAIARAVNDFLQEDLLGQANVANQLEGEQGEGRDPDLKVRTLLDRAARRIEGKFKDQPLTEAAIRHTLGDTYSALGDFPQAQKHLERAVRLRADKLGADHPSTLDSNYRLGLLYRAQGKNDQAEAIYKEVLAARTTQRGADHPDTLQVKNELALLYRTQKKYEQARSLLQEVVERGTTQLGPDHPLTLTGKTNLALVYVDLKQYQQAEKLYKEVIQTRITQLGPEHPDTLMSKHNLAILYRTQNQYKQAEPLFVEVLPVRSRVLGPDHPHTLASKYDLGVLRLAQRKPRQAEPLLCEAAEGTRTKLGMGHALTQMYLRVLIACYEQQSKHSDAEPLRRELAKLGKDRDGADSPEYSLRLAELGSNLLAQKKYAEAEPLLRECLAIRVKKEPDDWRTFYAQSMLGDSLLGLKKYAEAEPLLLQGYEGLKQREARIPANLKEGRLGAALKRLVRLYEATGQKDRAEAWRKKLQETKAAPKEPAKR
jgi:tetratricopeptide (TPR) repeat protein